MVDQPVRSNLAFNGNQIKQVLMEILASEPSTLLIQGRFWFNSNASIKRPQVHDGTAIKSIAYTDDVMTPAAHNHSIADVTNLQTTLDGKQATITGAATTVTTSNLAASMAMVTDTNGKIAASSTVTSTELGYLDGVTGAIQTQLDGKIPSSQKGVANGVATLDSGGKVPSSQIPGSVDDILEAASLTALNALAAAEKMTNRLYVALDTNITYRWSGTTFVEISPTIAVGNTTGAIGTASSEAASTASRSDHTHSVANKAITNAMIADSAVNTLQLASNAVTNAKMATDSVATGNIINSAVENTKLAQMPTMTVKANVTGGTTNPSDVTLASLFSTLVSQVSTLPQITRETNPSLTATGGVCTWTLAVKATRSIGSYKVASVQVYELGTDGGTTSSQVITAISIGKASGDIVISINSSATITAGTYVAVVTD